MEAMKERPILFSGPMVRAILAGQKSQTRRVIKPQPHAVRNSVLVPSGIEDMHGYELRCPYGKPSDRLWVREAHTFGGSDGESEVDVYYKADDAVRRCHLDMDDAEKASRWIESKEDGGDGADNWRPSIHMPRWASRITLEVVSVRVQRLQDISEDDAKAEGCTGEHFDLAVSDFIWAWGTINGKREGCAWDDNPWVWVIKFGRVQP